MVPIFILLVLVLVYMTWQSCSENFTHGYRHPRRHRRLSWYEHVYPWNWKRMWWGYPSVYDPQLSVPYYNKPVKYFNPLDNCHKKCADRHSNAINRRDFENKVNKCLDNYCY